MKKKKQRSESETRRPPISLRAQEAVEEAYQLIEDGKLEEAIELLRPLADKYPRDMDLFYQLGYAYYQTGDLWQAVVYLQKNLELSRDPELWLPLSAIYAQLGLRTLTLHALRQSIRQKASNPMLEKTQGAIAEIENELQQIAMLIDTSIDTVEKGLRFLEEGEIALQNADYFKCIYLNRSAIKILGTYPPPRNNLSLALFYSGQWEEAIQAARQVLGFDEQNIQALANIIRYLAWTGLVDEAKVYWERLKELTPDDDDLRVKMSEAASIVEDDKAVYDLLRPIHEGQLERLGLAHLAQVRLAIAEANLGKPTARNKLNQLKVTYKLAKDVLEALEKGQRGLGWSPRFPYFADSEYLPRKEFEKLLDLLTMEDEAPSKRSRKEIEQFAARFPQIVLVAKKTILEHQLAEVGIQLLARIGTPAAYAALREFGLGQYGPDEERMKALYELQNAGQIQPDETLRIWTKGEWRDVQLRRYEIKEGDSGERPYAQKVAELINEGQEAQQNDDITKAEKLFSQAIRLEPNAKEAYNNLGAIYAGRGEHEQAKAMFQKAVDVDPFYVLARCNLATYLLDDENIAEAEAMIAPLDEVSQYTPQMMAYLSYIRARIAVLKDEIDEARSHLEIAIQLDPAYEPAKELQSRIQLITKMRTGWDKWQQQQRKRNQAARARLQKQITTTDPSLEDMFSIYTKDAMTGMARVLAPSGGWSAYKKAELAKFLGERLLDYDILKWLVARLAEDDRKALYMVRDQGGFVPWKDFSAAFDNDLEESPYWQWHEPKTVMGCLRSRGLLVEATIGEKLYLAIPVELREPLKGLRSE